MAFCMRKFNTTGPCFPDEHYMLPALDRLPGIRELVAGGNYFVVHAPRQTGKTTALQALAQEINEKGDMFAVYCTLETIQSCVGNIEKAMQGIWNLVLRNAGMIRELEPLTDEIFDHRPSKGFSTLQIDFGWQTLRRGTANEGIQIHHAPWYFQGRG